VSGADGAATVDVGHLIDQGRWGLYQQWLVLVTALTIVFDGIDNQLMGVTIPTIMREWSVPRSAFAPVVSLGYLGMVIGGTLGGLLGDRVGRRTTLAFSMLLFGMMTLAASRAGSVPAFAVLRCLAGFGLGGAIPNAAALAAEYVPTRQRPLAVTITVVCTPVGAMVAGMLAIPMLPALGWRALFVTGGLLPIAGAFAVTRVLPESPRFLARHPPRKPELVTSLRRMGFAVSDQTRLVDSGDVPLEHATIGTLFTRPFRVDTGALWAAFFSSLLCIYLAFNWLPSLLTDAGFSSAMASAGILWFNLGGIIGAVAGALSIRRWGSRRSMLLASALSVAGVAALSEVHLSTSLAAMVFAMLAVIGALMNCVQSTMFALAAHVYPAGVRATGVGSASAFGRVGAIASGYVGVWALAHGGSSSFFGVFAIALTICFMALASVRRHIPPGSAAR
jgi:MFS transporter, AAHS family, 4-hydroxybenzoate transporter